MLIFMPMVCLEKINLSLSISQMTKSISLRLWCVLCDSQPGIAMERTSIINILKVLFYWIFFGETIFINVEINKMLWTEKKYFLKID
jgi:hypothetical protein